LANSIQQAIAPSRFKRRGSRLFLILHFPITVLDLGQTEMGRKPHSLVKRRVQSIIKEGRRFAVDVDLSKFFGRKLLLHFRHSNHPWLLPSKSRFINDHLSYKVKGKALLKLIAKYLRAGIMEKNHFVESREGVPQGGPLSPLLANIMLDPLDK